ncbi:MAG: barstar family protein [Jiangellaceae bacterium]
MPAWDPDAELPNAVDYRLVHNTFFSMFWASAILDDTVNWLVEAGYNVADLDAEAWRSAGDMFEAVASALGFPDYFGRNLDALNDCMRDVAAGDYGWPREATGLVMVLKAFDKFSNVDRHTAQALLDIFAGQARAALLIGNRLICLVQSDDPRLSFEPVGAMPVLWNDAEWLDAKRGL